MRAQAQRSSAANSDGSASRGAVYGSRDDATRALSTRPNGSGAPSHRRARFALGTLAAFFSLLAFAPSAFAAKEAINFFGTASGSGSLGGQLNNPRDIAVNRTGVGAPLGTTYVADDANNRIQRFDANGRFVSAWGADVVQAGGSGDQPGTNPFEVCVVASQCKAGAATGGNGTMAGNGSLDNPQSVAVDGDTGYVYVSDRDNRRVNAYDGSGNFLFSVGKDVADPNGGVAVEICVGGVDVCRAGDTGTGAGEVGSGGTAGTFGIAVSQPDSNAATGSVFLADSGNSRVNVYDLDGRNPTSFGAAGVTARTFGSTQPRNIAVGPTGVVYASNSNVGGEVERYDTGGAAFLDPITTPFNETQRITFTGFSAGNTFTLTCPDASVTDPITYSANATGRTNILNQLLADCGAGNFSASGNPPNTTITFQSAFELSDQPTMTCATVTGAGTCAISEEVDGNDGPLLSGSAAIATSGLAVSSAGTLYVLRDPSSGNTVVQQFNSPAAGVPPAADDDQHGAAAGFSTVQGFGLNDATGRLFVSATNSVGGLGSGHRVYALDDPVADPVVAIDPVTTKTDTTATLSGTVDPNGGYTTCKFQYATEPGFGGALEAEESDCASFDMAAGARAVSENVAGLDPNTAYYVRIQATQPFKGVTVNSPTTGFNTDAVPPAIADLGAIQITDTSARLVATIDPRNSATGYVFEYGTTPALGSQTPLVNIGGGTTPIVVSQVVSGLAKDTDYFFRIRATNLTGTTASSSKTFHTRAVALPVTNPGNCANEALRQSQSSTFLPDCRAFEQVTPVDKNGGDGFPGSTYVLNDLYTTDDGESVAFLATASFGDPPAERTFTIASYVTGRTVSGWGSPRPLQPPFCVQGLPLPSFTMNAPHFSADLEHAVFNQWEASPGCQIPTLDPDAPTAGAMNFYRSDLGDPASYDLLHPNLRAGSLSNGNQKGNAVYQGASDDQSQIALASTGAQTSDAAPEDANVQQLYLWQQLDTHGCTAVSPSYNAALEACLSLVSEDPTGNAVTTNSAVAASVGNVSLNRGNGNQEATNSVSDSGDRIFFQSPVQGISDCASAACKLYLREDNAVTYDVSQSECAASCGPDAADAFRLATPSGNRALFTSAQRLTDSDTSASSTDLFFYTHPDDPIANPPAVDPNNLTAVSIDNEAADGIAAAVQDVVGASEDLETVFFVADGQLVAGEPTAAGPKLYRWRWNSGAPALEYLATLDTSNAEFWENWRNDADGAGNKRRERRVTPDGGALMLESVARLDPAADHDGDVDVYRWTAGGGFDCVSCQLPGAPSGGPSDTGFVGLAAREDGTNVSTGMSTAISDDGERIFFRTQDSLVPGDTNGPCAFDNAVQTYPCTDVYQWHDGALSLITPGDFSGQNDVILTGITPSGNDVFFATRQPLVGWDQDTSIDLYTAHVGGGFAEPDAIGDICEGEACRAGGSVPPSDPGAGSGAFVGPENPTGAGGADNACGRISKQVKRKARALKNARRKGQTKRARALRKQVRNTRRRAKRCNRRQAR